MKKLLIVAGFVGTFVVGSMTGGIFSSANSNTGMNETSPNRMDENEMMSSDQGSGMMDMMGDSSDMGMMENMNEMMATMSIMSDLMANVFSEAAQTLDMTSEQLQNELKSGKSLATIAEEQGVKSDKLVKELEKVIQKEIKQFEKEGNVITDKQQEMLLTMSDNIEIMLNATGMFACNETLDETL